MLGKALRIALFPSHIVLALLLSACSALTPPPQDLPTLTITATPTRIAIAPTINRPSYYRELRFPNLAPNTGCPTSPVQPTSSLAPDLNTTLRRPNSAFASLPQILAVGEGPAYLVFGETVTEQGTVELRRVEAGLRGGTAAQLGPGLYAHVAIVWVPRYQGPVLIRNQRLDGPGQANWWKAGRDSSHDVQLGSSAAAFNIDGALSPFLHFPSPGCYALQIDGPDFSEVIVFNTVLPAQPRPTPSPSPAR